MKTKRSKLNKVTVFDVFLVVIMLAFCATIVVPFLHVIAVSLSDKHAVTRNEVGLWPVNFTLGGYVEMLSAGKFIKAYGVTFFVTIVGTLFSLSTTAMAAYALSRRKMIGHKLFSNMILFTMFFGGGMVPTYMLINKLGLLNNIWSLILPFMVSTWNLIIMRSFFVAYPQEIVESGYLDGLTDSGVFLRLVLPTSKAGLATIGLYYAVAYWNSYMAAKLYINDSALYPAQLLLQQMISSYTEEAIKNGEETNMVAAQVRNCAIIIVIAPIMCVYPFIQKYFVKGVMVGSIKG